MRGGVVERLFHKLETSKGFWQEIVSGNPILSVNQLASTLVGDCSQSFDFGCRKHL